MKRRNQVGHLEGLPGGNNIEAARAVALDIDGVQGVTVLNDTDETTTAVGEGVHRHLVTTLSRSHK